MMSLEKPFPESHGGGGGAGKIEKSPEREAQYWSSKLLRETKPEDREQMRNHESAVIEVDGDKVRVIWWVKRLSGKVKVRRCTHVAISHPDETVDVLKWENGSWNRYRGGIPEDPPLEPGEAEQPRLPGDAW